MSCRDVQIDRKKLGYFDYNELAAYMGIKPRETESEDEDEDDDDYEDDDGDGERSAQGDLHLGDEELPSTA